MPLKINLWLSAIKDLICNPINIPDEDIKDIEFKFSSKECAKEILEIIKKIPSK